MKIIQKICRFKSFKINFNPIKDKNSFSEYTKDN